MPLPGRRRGRLVAGRLVDAEIVDAISSRGSTAARPWLAVGVLDVV
jgi:hypothetical protein